MESSGEEILRKKYLDYRSRQLAGFFVYIPVEDIYRIAQRRAEERDDRGEISYGRMVALATDWLDGWVPLPPFHVWAEDYRRNPLPYENYFLGLWKSEEEPGS